MIVHLMQDIKFAYSEIEVFETFYPGISLYVFPKEVEFDKERFGNVKYMFYDKVQNRSWHEIGKDCGEKIDYVMVYYATDNHMRIALNLQRLYGSKIYWMFFGSDLYSQIERRYNYPLFDNSSSNFFHRLKLLIGGYSNWLLFRKFVSRIDSFCFWNPYDFQLLKKYIPCSAKYRFYTHGKGGRTDKEIEFPEKLNNQVQINHSASLTGNHLTILKKIKTIDTNNVLSLLIPLSYGDMDMSSKVELFLSGTKMNYFLLKNFMATDDYLNLINKSSVAIFGHNRQEAGGNIHFHILNGTKVFLRNRNNLLRLYRDIGLHVYSFEDDLKTIEDILTPLTLEQKKENAAIFSSLYSTDKVEQSMINFFD